jgi:hypothetical protein
LSSVYTARFAGIHKFRGRTYIKIGYWAWRRDTPNRFNVWGLDFRSDSPWDKIWPEEFRG